MLFPDEQQPATTRPAKKRSSASVPRVPQGHRTPLVAALLTNSKTAQSKLNKLRVKYRKKCQELSDLKKTIEDDSLLAIKDRISPALFKIIQCQLRNSKRKPKGYRYTDDEKVVFMGIHQTGPRGYRCLPIIKPSKKTIKTTLESLQLQPGINEIVIKSLKTRVSGMEEAQKHVSIVFDETAAKVHFQYCAATDLVTGFVDLGNGARRALAGEEVMVGMVRCIYGSWKQPIAFWYTNRKLTSQDFSKIFKECISAVLSTGLYVRCMVTDGLQKNAAAVRLLGSTMNKPFISVEGQKIFALSDVPHLLKSLRNALMKYPLILKNGTVIKKSYIDTFIRHDMQMQPRLCNKITETHLTPNNFQKMNVSLAAQLLSKKVAAGLLVYSLFGALPKDAMHTAKFCERINNFFDSWNGIEILDDQTTFKKALTDTSGHIKLWAEMFDEIKYWNFAGSTNLKFAENFLIAMQAVTMLWEDLKSEGFQFLPVGHINQDCLENFFSVLRQLGGHRHSIALNDVPSLFASALIRNLTTTVKGKNCRDDNALNLLHLKTLLDSAKAAKQTTKQQDEINEDHTFFFEENAALSVTEEEDIEDEEEEEEEEIAPDQPVLILTDAQFCQKILDRMSSVNGAYVVAPLIEKHSKALDCADCRGILQTSPAFPLHALHMVSSSLLDQQQPSEIITKCVEDIFKTAYRVIPPIAHEKILGSFLPIVEDLASVKRLQLCPVHVDRTHDIIRDICRAAVENLLISMNQNYKLKKQQGKKSQKLQTVSHH
ncbi:Transposable element P transposase [Frankliniella fusca]|uniref:Transposable element P transposase n=1 Tax=Frankliniella fusca TaxID=407009 RepID=A0AAE1HU87_9NEOP|nr:Transposable element P transposase [Frankliniella fusca]